MRFLLTLLLLPGGARALDIRYPGDGTGISQGTADDRYLNDDGDTSEAGSTYTIRGKFQVDDVLQVTGGLLGSGVLQVTGGTVGRGIRVTDSATTIMGVSTLTVQGNAFSVGGASFTVLGSSVGVRTNSPASALDVAGGSTFRGQVTVDAASMTVKNNGTSIMHFEDYSNFRSVELICGSNSCYLEGGTSDPFQMSNRLDFVMTFPVSENPYFNKSLTVISTLAVAGNAFSVGGASFTVLGSSVGVRTANPGAGLHVSTSQVVIDGNNSGLVVSSGATAGIVVLGILGTSVSIDWGATAANTCDAQDLATVTWATLGRTECWHPSATPDVEATTCNLSARASANGTLTVKRCNNGLSACADPASAVHQISCMLR